MLSIVTIGKLFYLHVLVLTVPGKDEVLALLLLVNTLAFSRVTLSPCECLHITRLDLDLFCWLCKSHVVYVELLID